MANWASLEAMVNSTITQVFGEPEPVLYQFIVNDVAAGDPVPITVLRRRREHDESDAVANVEEISVDPAQLPQAPQRGDLVTAWGSQFVVATPRQPDPYGFIELTLIMQATPLPNAPAPPPAQ
jgi:hypothetical protein